MLRAGPSDDQSQCQRAVTTKRRLLNGTAMGYMLRPDVSFTVANGRNIFLDLHHDRYFALESPVSEAFEQLLASGDISNRGIADHGALNSLISKGVLQYRDSNLRPEPCELSTPPTDSLLDQFDCGRSWWTTSAIVYLLSTELLLRWRPLVEIVSGIRRRKEQLRLHPVPHPTRSIDGIAAGFDQAGLFVPRRDKCLQNSIAIMRQSLRFGYRPEMVFAVMGQPFQAHCWVQYDGVLLNDRIDNVVAFTPILVV